MDFAYPLCGFLVGSLVGFTGIGGGSVMTPLLILVFGVHPALSCRHRSIVCGCDESDRRENPCSPEQR